MLRARPKRKRACAELCVVAPKKGERVEEEAEKEDNFFSFFYLFFFEKEKFY